MVQASWVATLALAALLVVATAPAASAELEISLRASTSECSGSGEIDQSSRFELNERRVLRGDDEDEDEDDEDEEDELELKFGSHYREKRGRVQQKLKGFIVNFDTFDLADAVCAAELTLDVGNTKGEHPFGPSGWCTIENGCLSVDVATTRFGFGDNPELDDDSDFDAPGTNILVSASLSDDGAQLTLELDAAVLSNSLGWEHTQIRVRPLTAVTTSRKATVEFHNPILSMSSDICVITETLDTVTEAAGLPAVFQTYPPSWTSPDAPNAVDMCTAQPELCSWDSASAPALGTGCLASACSIQPIGGSGQIDGGFDFSGFLVNGRAVVMGIRPSHRTCGLAPQGQSPSPVPTGDQTQDRWFWNYDLHLSDPDGDLFSSGDIQYSLQFSSEASGSLLTTSITLDAGLDSLLGAGFVSPLVLSQSSVNLGFASLAAIEGAIGFDHNADGNAMSIDLIATLRADGSELGRASISVINTPGGFECGGANCADPAIGCLPCSDPNASC